jgi:hypothetical protein
VALSDLTAPDAVFRALREFEELGREPFLAKYGFRKARSYFLVHEGRAYDSKAIAGAGHGYQHPERGPLQPTDFSGGDATVKARLEALGFTVVVTEPATGDTRSLALFEDYSRREVHDIFAPRASFSPGAGLWGLSGIVEHQPGDFVLFVTFGREQGDHLFDEGVTPEGVVSWQSQPQQALNDPQVRRLIAHDSETGNVRLFLRTATRTTDGATMPYTYLGRLAYVTHDAERERPVYFQWQLIDAWPPPAAVLERIGLALGDADAVIAPRPDRPAAEKAGLLETSPPSARDRTGRRTSDFQGRKAPDRSLTDARNRALGLAGELAVIAREQDWLRRNGRADLAELVRHVAVVEGDGAGYDVASAELDGSATFIEVKTTRGGPETSFFVTANEVEFSRRHGASYRLYRLYDFSPESGAGSYYVKRGALADDPSLQLEPIQFRARLVAVPGSPDAPRLDAT